MTNKESRKKTFKENRKTILQVCPFPLFPSTTKSRTKQNKKKKKPPFKRRQAVSVLTTEINFLNRGFTHC